MNRVLSIIVSLMVMCPIALVWRAAHALSPPEITPATKRTAHPSRTHVIDYRNGRISANIENVPMGKVIVELQHVTELMASVDDSVAEWPVFVRLEGASLKEAVTTILDGFSYAMFPTPTGLMVVVVSTPPKTERTHRSPTAPLNTVGTSESTSMSGKPASSLPTAATDTPQTLDEFRSIQSEAFGSTPNTDSGEGTDQSEPLLAQQRREEARLDRALDALRSEYSHLFKEALNDLIGINDERATRALIDAVATPSDRISRSAAVEALAHHVTNLQFADKDAVDALKQLVDDSDEQVRTIARDTLAEMQGLE